LSAGGWTLSPSDANDHRQHPADHLGKDNDVDSAPGTDARALSEVLDVLDALAATAEGDAVTVEALVTTLGRRSFPTLVLAPSLIAVSPVSGIPGMSSTIGLLVATITAQMLWGRQSAWLPGFLTRRQIKTARLRRALDWLRRPVRALERVAKPRLVLIVSRPFVVLPLSVMLATALAMPLLELVPLSATIAGSLLSVFAVGLLVRDGALVLLALALSAVAPLVVWTLAT
jgi:hypothetical protein